jgi:hypothetical protein
MTSTDDSVLPSSPHGTPPSKCSDVTLGGARFGEGVPRQHPGAASGMLPCEVRVSLPPMLTPHKPRLME